MAKQKKKNNSAFRDLPLTSPEFEILAYERVLAGGAWIDGKWQKVTCLPNFFWNKDVAKILARYFVFEMKKWGREEVCNHFTTALLRKEHLTGVCKQFANSTYEVVKYCFPEWRIEPWELKCCPNSFWHDPENCAKACRWICEKEGIADDRQVFCQSFSANMLRKYGIAKAMIRSGGLYGLAALTFPKWKLKPWHLRKIGQITPEMVTDAVTWMVDEKLMWTHTEVCENISAKVFYDHGLGSILSKGCGHSPLKALQIAYPGQYERQMLKNAENPFRK